MLAYSGALCPPSGTFASVDHFRFIVWLPPPPPPTQSCGVREWGWAGPKVPLVLELEILPQ